jgi:thiol-disulfide isomerase/thioredoxin
MRRRGTDRSAAVLASRRNLLLSALATGTLSMWGETAAAQESEIPPLESGNYQFTIIQPQQEMPSLRLFRLEGGTLDLASLRGKPILLNFWATWCAACRMELVVLDRQYRGPWRDKLHVLAVSEDRSDRKRVARFVNVLGVTALPIFLDPNRFAAYSDRGNRKGAPFALYGMPITYAISSSGSIVGYMPGAADWSATAASDLIAYLRNT